MPYRVAINEAVELAKYSLAAPTGHKYVNGVLDHCAAELRLPRRGRSVAEPPLATSSCA
ncbi:MAG: hypothetical protein IPG77_05630 [Betaproteobacteria bacterium]|nr:hypothetical protein [Betaproteobacteria bacterium]